jgi:hypothetical protein
VSVWLLLIVMSLAVYRLTRLVVEDTFPPVLWLRDRLVGGWRPLTVKEQEIVAGQPGGNHPFPLTGVDGVQQRWNTRRRWSPFWLAELLSCPWCASGWVALAVTAGTWATVGLAVPLLVWPAVWGAGALLAAQEWA